MTLRPLGCLMAVLMIVLPEAPAQNYTVAQLDDLGIKFQIHEKLDGVPLELTQGAVGLHLRGRYRPTKDHHYIPDGLGVIYEWGMHVLEFDLTAGRAKPTTGKKPKTKADAQAAAREAHLEKRRAKNFVDFVTSDKDPSAKNRKFVVKAKKNRARGEVPAYEYWEYFDDRQSQRGTKYRDYHLAAVYDFGDREVALVFDWPIFRGKKARSEKEMKLGQKMIKSLKLLSDRERGSEISRNDEKDEFANTPERETALANAIENIKDLDGWDYFTTPNFICLYSWPPDRSEKRKDSRKFAEQIASDMEDVQEIYRQYYPPHEKMANYWPVMRICHSKDLFDTYGGTSGGTIGWFNPASKELVFFDDVNGIYGGNKGVRTVAFHEGFHQYSDAYFLGARQHRWFGEGVADFMGGFVKKGRKWSYIPSKMRLMGPTDIRQQARSNSYVPLREIVTWNTDKFYGAKAPYYYSQGWAMVDFFYRGEKRLRSKWNERWSQVIPTYSKVLLETRSQKKAVEQAFADIDWDEIDKAWVEYCRRHITKK